VRGWSNAAQHLSTAVDVVAELLPVLITAVKPESAELAQRVGSTIRRLGNIATLENADTGEIFGQLNLSDLQQFASLGVSPAMAFQLAGAIAIKQALDQIDESLAAVEEKVDEILRNQRDEMVAGLAAQEQLLAQVIAMLAAGAQAGAAVLARLRDIEATLQPLALRLVAQVERHLGELDQIGAELDKFVASAERQPTLVVDVGASRKDKAVGLARCGGSRAMDIAMRSVSTARSADLLARIVDVGESVTWAEESLAAALRAVSARAMAGLLANSLDTSQPPAVAEAEAKVIRQHLTELQDRLEVAGAIRWVNDLDDDVRARMFVGQRREKELIAELSPRPRRLEADVDAFAAALPALAGTGDVVYELSPP
jgi:hypothetical protein